MANVIYKDEECYGFLDDIILELQEQIKTADKYGEDDLSGMLNNALNEAGELSKDIENYNYFYKMWLHPMGSFCFTKISMKEEN